MEEKFLQSRYSQYIKESFILSFIGREVKDISTNEYFKSSYIKTHMRASAYCFGLLYGYIVYRIQNSDTKISKVKTSFYTYLFKSFGEFGCLKNMKIVRKNRCN
jgi:hypothetical protein